MNASTRNILLTEHKSKSTIKSLSLFSVNVQVSKVHFRRAYNKSVQLTRDQAMRSSSEQLIAAGSEKSGSEEISIVNKCSLLQVAIRVEK
jgi:hypothetical protein